MPSIFCFFFSLGATELSGEAQKASRKAATSTTRSDAPRCALASEKTSGIQGAIFKTGNGEWENGNGEQGTGNL